MMIVKGVVMVGVIMLSRRFHINPDNVATPIAASLGDLTTISLLAALARGLYTLVDMSTCADTNCSEFTICGVITSVFHACCMCCMLLSCTFNIFLRICNLSAL